MTSKDIEQRIWTIETRIFGLRIKVNSHYISGTEFRDAMVSKAELANELEKLREKLKLNNLRKEKLEELNNLI